MFTNISQLNGTSVFNSHVESRCTITFTLSLSFLLSSIFQERHLSLSVMLSTKKSDPGSSSSSGGNGGDRAPDILSAPQTVSAGPSGPSIIDVKKKERASPSGEPGGPPLPHPPGPGGIDQDSAEGRRTSRRKRAKVNISISLTCAGAGTAF